MAQFIAGLVAGVDDKFVVDVIDQAGTEDDLQLIARHEGPFDMFYIFNLIHFG
ncbi:hypothetical protein SDC9_173735 [bioreactor metagenome]|uniref:Uncharacterized protein n=1 Tax=bioreactor metagenome TaxID=1076179 RepID=A0A645GH75_9ZZZZ